MKDIIINVISFVITVAIIAVILALPIMIVWNAVIPDICGFTKINFWQALYLAFLGRFLCGVGASNKE